MTVLKYEVIRRHRRDWNTPIWTEKTIARLPSRRLAGLYARVRDYFCPQPYHFFVIKER